ncbi:MAG TPA: hypothetical protein VKG89_08470 [Solirubrobacterales bacterium]|nr:hypothetical protein [Solirubrobacterales bacterium]
MTDGREIPQPTELVYVPDPSWAPALIAVGATAVATGLFAGWPYAVVGAIIGLASLRAWIRSAGADADRLPRRQRPSSAVLPAVPLRSAGDGRTSEES